MNTDEKLRQLLTDAADSYDPPSIVPRAGWRQRLQQRMGQQRLLQWVAAAVVGCLVIVGLGFAIGTHRSSSGSDSAASSGSASVPQAAIASSAANGALSAPAGAAAGSPKAAGGTASTGGASVPTQASRVVQTGQLALEVARGQVSPVLTKLAAIANGSGGYISASRDDDTQNLPSGTSTLRVPVASFDAVTAQVRKLGSVTSASSQAKDVTSQYVDLGARIAAGQQTRDAYYTLLTKTTTIGDTLAVQETLQTAQTALEQLQGQQKVLADSSDLATLSVDVVQKSANPAPVVKPASHDGFGKALRRTGHAFNTGLQGVITALGPILLVLMILAVLGAMALLGRRLYRVLTR